MQILAQAKPKEPPTDALPTFAGIYTQLKRVGILSKEQVSGKLIDEWNKTLATAEAKPDAVDVGAAISSLLAVKDEEELVSAPHGQCICLTFACVEMHPNRC